MADLAALSGLDPVKADIGGLIAAVRAERARQTAGMAVRPAWKNLVLAGGPGTGKSRVAAIVGRIYRDLGVLSSGHLVEVTHADLTGEYARDSAPLVRAAVNRALGGVPLISDGHDPGGASGASDRAATSSLQELVTEHRGNLVVILAGPATPVRQHLQDNRGLAAQFPVTLEFAGYTGEELAAIFTARAQDAGFTLAAGARDKASAVLVRSCGQPGAGSARLAIGLLDRAAARQARRTMTGAATVPGAALRELLADDIPAGLTPASSGQLPADPFGELEQMTGLASVERLGHAAKFAAGRPTLVSGPVLAQDLWHLKALSKHTGHLDADNSWLRSPLHDRASSSRARVAATYSSDRSRSRASVQASSAYCSSRSGLGIAPWLTPNSSTLENSVPLARCIVIVTGCPGLMCSRSTARMLTPRSARPVTKRSRCRCSRMRTATVSGVSTPSAHSLTSSAARSSSSLRVVHAINRGTGPLRADR